MSLLFRTFLALLAAGLAGCATTESKPKEEQISSIPWNKPASWEGQGAFGSMLQGSR
jgi:hypothetical protein